MKITFAHELPKNFSGNYAHYHHRRSNAIGAAYCDIRALTVEKQRKWLQEIETWHSKLSEAAIGVTPLWWFINGSRFHTWFPPIYNPFIFAVAVLEYCKERNIQEITLLNCPQETIEYLHEIAENNDYQVSDLYQPDYLHHASQLKRLVKNAKDWLVQIFKSVANLGYVIPDLREIKLLIYSHIVGGDIDPNRPDHFYGTMFDKIPGLEKAKTLWFYFSDSPSLKIHDAFVKNLELQKKRFLILQKLITPGISLRIAVDYIRLLFSYSKIQAKLPPVVVCGYSSTLLANHYFQFQIRNIFPLKELEVFYAFQRLMQLFPNIEKVYYPYEEKCLEHAMLKAIAETASPVKPIGYSHSIHNYLHMYFRTRPAPLANPPRPEFFTVTGAAEKEWLVHEAGVAPEKIEVVGSSRYAD